MTPRGRVLVVDNADSFVHTLCDYLEQLGANVHLVAGTDLADDMVPDLVRASDSVLISPGPGAPRNAVASKAVLCAAIETRIPVLGVCLGHQVIAETFGATVTTAHELLHGMTSTIDHDGAGVFDGLPQGFSATRYHSLAVRGDTVTDDLVVTARTPSGTIMGIRHRTLPIEGVQFHPESVLSQGGFRLLGNWLAIVGLATALPAAAGRDRLT